MGVWRRELVEAINAWLTEWGITDSSSLPIDPYRIAYLLGIRVTGKDFGQTSGINAILYKGEVASTIALNKAYPRVRKRFTLAHELVHYLFHPFGAYCETSKCTRNPYEVQANFGAAELLMPAQLVVEAVWELGPEVDRIATRFGTSKEATRIRLVQLGFGKYII